MSDDDWRHPWCPGCTASPFHTPADCDPLRRDRPGLVCACWSCLPNDHETPHPTTGLDQCA